MVTFIDGPATGVVLELRRAPVFLRVVRSRETGNWDALDKIGDAPAIHEDVYVYRRHGEVGTVHLDGRDRRTGKRFAKWLSVAEYRLATQPEDATLRDITRWREWAMAAFAEQADTEGGSS